MSNGSGGPHGMKLTYDNVALSITAGKIDIQLTTETSVVGIQIDQQTGKVIGGSNAPRQDATTKA